jgi:hypothetical protein
MSEQPKPEAEMNSYAGHILPSPATKYSGGDEATRKQEESGGERLCGFAA